MGEGGEGLSLLGRLVVQALGMCGWRVSGGGRPEEGQALLGVLLLQDFSVSMSFLGGGYIRSYPPWAGLVLLGGGGGTARLVLLEGEGVRQVLSSLGGEGLRQAWPPWGLVVQRGAGLDVCSRARGLV